ncbi:MAG: hypothetical protein AAGB22_05895, partial [Bacteroidota bacterium]
MKCTAAGRGLFRAATVIGLLLIGTTASATHIVGANIQYTCIAPGSYEVSLRIYRDCSGITLPTTATITATDTCGTSLTATLPQDTVMDISPVCAAQIGQNACNGGLLSGYELVVYKDTVMLNQNCAQWALSWTTCCRNAGITNIGGGNAIYVESILNIANQPCNHSA